MDKPYKTRYYFVFIQLKNGDTFLSNTYLDSKGAHNYKHREQPIPASASISIGKNLHFSAKKFAYYDIKAHEDLSPNGFIYVKIPHDEGVFYASLDTSP